MEIYKYLDERTVNIIEKHPQKEFITELRFKDSQPAQATISGKTEYIDNQPIYRKQLEDMLYNMCRKSINVYEEEISSGYITLENGDRAGISGEFFYNKETDKYILKHIQAINIRIVRDVTGFVNQDKLSSLIPRSTLIIGPPHSGKTSLLKWYTQQLAQKYRVTLCDERKELSANLSGCDVLSGIKKYDAIYMAVRNLNPQFIVCDEIGHIYEAEQILSAVNTGVKFVCSAHGENYNQVLRRPSINKLIENKVFERIVTLKQKESKFYIEDITDV